MQNMTLERDVEILKQQYQELQDNFEQFKKEVKNDEKEEFGKVRNMLVSIKELTDNLNILQSSFETFQTWKEGIDTIIAKIKKILPI